MTGSAATWRQFFLCPRPFETIGKNTLSSILVLSPYTIITPINRTLKRSSIHQENDTRFKLKSSATIGIGAPTWHQFFQCPQSFETIGKSSLSSNRVLSPYIIITAINRILKCLSRSRKQRHFKPLRASSATTSAVTWRQFFLVSPSSNFLTHRHNPVVIRFPSSYVMVNKIPKPLSQNAECNREGGSLVSVLPFLNPPTFFDIINVATLSFSFPLSLHNNHDGKYKSDFFHCLYVDTQ